MRRLKASRAYFEFIDHIFSSIYVLTYNIILVLPRAKVEISVLSDNSQIFSRSPTNSLLNFNAFRTYTHCRSIATDGVQENISDRTHLIVAIKEVR